jgi:DNA-binding transcriptional MerR regulator
MTTTEAPERRYRIAEVSRLTGFTPTTLRYYEDAGVLAPPDRTAAGYRIYDDRAVERLRLVARAKELGCTLEEIAGLVEAWDAGDCGPVKHRLRSLVHTKVGEIERHLTEQVAFAVQLRSTAANLAGRPVDGPCDDSCGCTSAVPADDDPVSVETSGCGTECGCGSSDPEPVALGAASGTPPIACSLDGGDMQARIGDWQALLTAVDHREAIPNGVRLNFGDGAPLVEIARLARAEFECCPFFSFTVRIDTRGVVLEVTAPMDGQVLLDSVFGAAS